MIQHFALDVQTGTYCTANQVAILTTDTDDRVTKVHYVVTDPETGEVKLEEANEDGQRLITLMFDRERGVDVDDNPEEELNR